MFKTSVKVFIKQTNKKSLVGTGLIHLEQEIWVVLLIYSASLAKSLECSAFKLNQIYVEISGYGSADSSPASDTSSYELGTVDWVPASETR